MTTVCFCSVIVGALFPFHSLSIHFVWHQLYILLGPVPHLLCPWCRTRPCLGAEEGTRASSGAHMMVWRHHQKHLFGYTLVIVFLITREKEQEFSCPAPCALCLPEFPELLLKSLSLYLAYLSVCFLQL